MKVDKDGIVYHVQLKKYRGPSAYIGSMASYEVLVEGFKVGKLAGRFSRICGAFQQFVDRNDVDTGVGFVGVRGIARDRLNEQAIVEYLKYNSK